jgi:cobalt-zinc-cadmium resistance protein CzcA
VNRILQFFLSNRWLVLIGVVLLLVGGLTVMLHLPIEAFPDLTNNQVVVTAQAPGMSPVEVEQLVTFPLETSLLGMPDLQVVRSTSKLELSMVTVIFDDSVDLYRARQLVAERIAQAQSRLPAGIQPEMGPMSTAFGEVYQYTVQSPDLSLMQLKTLNDWTIRYALLTIPGVSEINSWGGYSKEYSVVVDPEQLRRYNLTLHQVVTAVQNNNANFGGSYIEHAGQMYTVRGIGRAEDLGDLGNIVLATSNGIPVLLKQVASLQVLPMIRHGAVMHDSKGETVSGMVIILRGANGNKIIQEVKDKIQTMKLPGHAKIIPFYDQSNVIDGTIHTVKKNLLEAAVLVIVILLLFLGDWRAALIVAVTIPFSLLFAFLGMGAFGISANLMSLGAIDFGTIVDGSVVMVENCMHRLENGPGEFTEASNAESRNEERDDDGHNDREHNDREHNDPEHDDREQHSRELSYRTQEDRDKGADDRRSDDDREHASKPSHPFTNTPDLLSIVRQAAGEVARPITFGVLIILAVYLPVLTLQDLAGRMFRPMAVTVMSALTGSLLLALFVVPAVCSIALGHKLRQLHPDPNAQPGWFARMRQRFSPRWAQSATTTDQTARSRSTAGHKQKSNQDEGWFGKLRDRYARSLDKAESHRRLVVIIAVVLVAVALGSLPFIGTEFMPTLDEGSLVITSKKLPGISLTESIAIQAQIERVIKSFPEVSSVVSKMGRPDLATEAMGVYETDAYISFIPKKDWRCCKTKQELSDKLETALDKIPGASYEFTQPMEMRMDETITGTRGAAALKIFGPDLGMLETLGNKALGIISSVKGASQPQLERIAGAANLEIKVNREEAARYGLNVSDIQEVIESLVGSRQISEMVQGEQRFPIAVRLPSNIRNNLDAIYALQLQTPTGALVRLDQVTDIHRVSGPILINRENAHRRIVVSTNVEGRDLGSFVKDAQKQIDSKLDLPPGYSIDWGGQYQNEQLAEQRLAFVLPLSLLLIAGLLYATFQNLRQTILILLIVPLALVGGIAALWLRGINLNLSASIGFIALFGVAVLNGVVMVSHINNLRSRGVEMAKAVRQGASDRLRPVLITATVASLGFIPMALATSRGAEVQRPLATVVIGGLVTATLLTLYLLPVLYPVFSRKLKP